MLSGLGEGKAVTLQVFGGTTELVVDLVGYQTFGERSLIVTPGM